MQRLFKRSTDEVVEGSHQMVDFALDSDPSDPPQLRCWLCGGGFWVYTKPFTRAGQRVPRIGAPRHNGPH